MREWSLKTGDPLALVISADASLGPTDYTDDQIWELTLGGSDPPAVTLHTTFGLRARAFRLFPRFRQNADWVTTPAEFHTPPVVTRFFPGYLALTFSPFPYLDVLAEYWVPDSHGVCGRLTLTNQSSTPAPVRLEWVAYLMPNDGERMAPVKLPATSAGPGGAAPAVLQGSTGGLAPVVFLTGGAQAGTSSFPSLTLDLVLAPNDSRPFVWAAAACAKAEQSFDLARSLSTRTWEAELARTELFHSRQVEIFTGDPDWDAAFGLAQQQAMRLFIGPTRHLPALSFSLSRQPDQGYSLRGDGSDYNHLWNGQSSLISYFLGGLVLPGSVDLAKGLLENFLAVQAEDGSIDWKPGLAGQRGRLLAAPLLATFTLRIYDACLDRNFLEQAFPKLARFVDCWLANDQDNDGLPEWEHPMQAGLDDHPIYSRWQLWAEGLNIRTTEGPALCALLYSELHSLMYIAQLLDQTESLAVWEAAAEKLKTATETAWDPDLHQYQDWDRDTHLTPEQVWLGERLGPGTLLLDQRLEQPARLLVRILTTGESTRRPTLFVHGVNQAGKNRIEQIGDEHILWSTGRASVTTEVAYQEVEKIEIQGIDPEDQVLIFQAGLRQSDISQLLPLWAGIPDAERAELLVKNTILTEAHFWRKFGLPTYPYPPDETAEPVCSIVNIPWNCLVGEGLLRYGYRQEAAALLGKIMPAVVQALKKDGAFRRYYHAVQGHGSGERNALNGLAPLRFFLDTLGLRIISPREIILTDLNPFPWPVTVKYRGLTILRQKEKTMVIFPDGQTTVVSGAAPQRVALE